MKTFHSMLPSPPMTTAGCKEILVVDDEENIRHLLDVVLRGEGMRVTLARSAAEALAALAKTAFDAVLADIRMPGMDGLTLLAELRQRQPAALVIIMSAYGTVETALEAIKRGAADYIAKPFKAAEVLFVLRKAEERERLRVENQQLRADLEQVTALGLGEMVGQSAPMQAVFETVRKVAPFKTTVLITGESGTGKELVAQAIHQLGPRRAGPFVAVNCGAIPESLLESELFGHKRGAFTDATADKKGLFTEAHGGTIFLDEIGELPLSLQVKLLRVLQEAEVRRVGDTKAVAVDTRVVAATAIDLAAAVEAGRFRADLYYRLNVLTVALPALRERSEDIPRLIAHFIARHNRRLGLALRGIDADALKVLRQQAWPGNVRELENAVERAMVMAGGAVIDRASLSAGLSMARERPAGRPAGHSLSIKQAVPQLERELIAQALAQTGGNRSAAARLLEISHRALLYKIRDYGLEAA